MASLTQQVGTSYEALDIPGDLTPVGDLFIKNNDPTNYLDISFDGGSTEHLKLRPGRKALFQPVGAVHVRFNTLAGQVYFAAVEE